MHFWAQVMTDLRLTVCIVIVRIVISRDFFKFLLFYNYKLSFRTYE